MENLNGQYDNIIPVGWQCFNAQTLVRLKLRKQSFPFDYIRCSPVRTYEFLASLKENVPINVDRFLSSNSRGVNEDGIYVGHFIDIDYNPEHHKCFTYKGTDETINKFDRRFKRLKQAFFDNKNILLFNDIGVKNHMIKPEWSSFLHKIKLLNPNNTLFIFTYSDRDIYDDLEPLANLIKLNYSTTDVSLPNDYEAKVQLGNYFKKYFGS